jgi:hypothetical protein
MQYLGLAAVVLSRLCRRDGRKRRLATLSLALQPSQRRQAAMRAPGRQDRQKRNAAGIPTADIRPDTMHAEQPRGFARPDIILFRGREPLPTGKKAHITQYHSSAPRSAPLCSAAPNQNTPDSDGYSAHTRPLHVLLPFFLPWTDGWMDGCAFRPLEV